MANITASCLGIVLSLYNYDAVEQYNSFIDLLELSGIEIPAQYVSEICPKNGEYETIDWLMSETQKHMWIRTKKPSGKLAERWESPIPKSISNNADQIIKKARDLGILNAVYPTSKDYECVLFFGATAPFMALTLEYGTKLLESHKINNPKTIYLLSGARFAESERDGADLIKQVAKEKRISTDHVTEAYLMEYLYEEIKIRYKILDKIPYELINTPAKNGNRPTTYTTLVDFFKRNEDSNHCKNILAISKAPFIAEQGQVVKNFMYMNYPEIKFEIIGGEAHVMEAKSNTDAARYITTTIAAFIYGAYPEILMKINFKYNMCPAIDIKNPNNSIPSLGSSEFKYSVGWLNNYRKLYLSSKMDSKNN